MNEREKQSDIKGKRIAQTIARNYGIDMETTKEETNQLDGRFSVQYNTYGMEAKEMRNTKAKNAKKSRWQYDDLLVETAKVEYSFGEGKQASGLTTAFFFNWLEFVDFQLCYVLDYAKCIGLPTKWLRTRKKEFDPSAGYELSEFYLPKRSVADLYLVHGDQVEELTGDRRKEYEAIIAERAENEQDKDE